MPQEETTVPGEWPGIYACDRRKLLSVYNSTLRAAVSTLHGDVVAAEVGAWCTFRAVYGLGVGSWRQFAICLMALWDLSVMSC